MDLDGQVALVTGAGGGIGPATVKALVDAGARVVVVERDDETGQQAVDHAGGEDVAPDSIGRRRQRDPKRRARVT